MGPERGPRYFFALWPSEAAAATLAGLRDRAQQVRDGRAMPADALHCTLVFVGELDDAALARAMAAADAVRAAPCDVCFDRLDYWPHNRIVWAGASSPPAALTQLADRLHAGLQSAGFGSLSPLTMPHITLLRSARPLGRLPSADAVRWPCNEFVLARSAKKEASSSRYEVLARWPLAGGGE